MRQVDRIQEMLKKGLTFSPLLDLANVCLTPNSVSHHMNYVTRDSYSDSLLTHFTVNVMIIIESSATGREIGNEMSI